MEIISILGTALGSSWTSGINLYATVTILGLLQHFGLAKLPGGLQALDNWWVIGIAAFFFVIEFFADKIPYVDSVWDVIHTFIRIPAGAALAFAATSEVNPTVQILALLAGGGVALTSHGTKASLRAAANLSPEPVSNWALSFTEDALAIGGTFLTAFLPIVILVVVVVFLFIFAWLAPKVYRRVRRIKNWFRSFVSSPAAA
jgi:hypothetical protein